MQRAWHCCAACRPRKYAQRLESDHGASCCWNLLSTISRSNVGKNRVQTAAFAAVERRLADRRKRRLEEMKVQNQLAFRCLLHCIESIELDVLLKASEELECECGADRETLQGNHFGARERGCHKRKNGHEQVDLGCRLLDKREDSAEQERQGHSKRRCQLSKTVHKLDMAIGIVWGKRSRVISSSLSSQTGNVLSQPIEQG